MSDLESSRERVLPLSAGPVPPLDRAEARVRAAARPDPKRSQVRDRLVELDGAIATLRSSPTPASVEAVAEAARGIASELDLGAEPTLVACRVCKRLGMVGATRCGFCWASLQPVA
jgi:hypothetical protein